MAKSLIVSRLRPILTQSKTQRDNPALFQVINSLIEQVDTSAGEINTIISGGGGGGTPVKDISDLTFTTELDESADLPNSRQLLPGSGILFDYSIANQLQIKVSPALITGGDVVGPSSASDNAIARFDGTTGKLIQNSLVVINDSGNITSPGTLSLGTNPASAGIIKLPNNGFIYGRNVANTVDINIIGVNTDNNIYVGQAGVNFLPNNHNAQDIGLSSGWAWRNAYLSGALNTGTVQATGNITTGAQVIASNGLGSTPLNASQLLSGTVPVARLPPNIAFTDVSNNFTASQNFITSQPGLFLSDTSQPLDQKNFLISNNTQALRISAQNDAQSTNVDMLALNRQGLLYLLGSTAGLVIGSSPSAPYLKNVSNTVNFRNVSDTAFTAISFLTQSTGTGGDVGATCQYVLNSIASTSGSWSPSLFANGGGTGNYAALSGWYRKHANGMVYVTFNIQSNSAGTLNGFIGIQGLPFAVATGSSQEYFFPIAFDGINGNVGNLMLHVLAGATSGYLRFSAATTGNLISQTIQAVGIVGGTIFRGSFVYPS